MSKARGVGFQVKLADVPQCFISVDLLTVPYIKYMYLMGSTTQRIGASHLQLGYFIDPIKSRFHGMRLLEQYPACTLLSRCLTLLYFDPLIASTPRSTCTWDRSTLKF